MPARQSTNRQALSCTGSHKALVRQQRILSIQLPAASGGDAGTDNLVHGLPGSLTFCDLKIRL